MRTARPSRSAPRCTPLQRATAALGLICVLASGSCWAQQSSSSTDAKAATAAAASGKQNEAKPTVKKTDAKRAAKSSASASSKTSKASKSQKQTAAKADVKDTAKDKKAKADEDKSTATAQAVSPKSESRQESRSDAKPEVRTADARAAEATPPAGTMMGAYGQSLMRAPAGPTATTVAAVAATTAVAATATAQATTPPATSSTAAAAATPSLPPTAMMGAAGGNSNASESVARFLQQRGLLAQAQSTGGDPAAPGLLNQVRDKASDLVLSAMNFLGVPYKRGGNSVNNGFDCSGFTRHIFEMSVGLVLPRRADEQAKMSSLIPIKKEDLKPGDLVFFNTMRATFSHVGIYVGEGKFIHSPRVGGAVRVEDMREAYWAKRFTGGRRADLNQANAGG
ncbi:C40 family peptidase [Roseateles sp. MS654]|uniref:C40 family peptidase n=1 Tax=Roseateles sp. MS654 TaxID=3412685 RepID=UPI003C2F3FDF